jgi:hypothetical protein
MPTPFLDRALATGVSVLRVGLHHSIPPQPFMWTTADRRSLRIADMTDAHLCNTIAYLRQYHGLPNLPRRSAGQRYVVISQSPQPQFDDYGTKYLTEVSPLDAVTINASPLHRHMLLEAMRRGLKVEE